MFAQLKRYVAAPVFTHDPESTENARVLHLVLLLSFVVAGLLMLEAVVSRQPVYAVFDGAAAILSLVGLWLLRAGKIRQVRLGISLSILAITYGLVLLLAGLNTTTQGILLVATTFSGLMLGMRAGWLTMFVSLALGLVVHLADLNNWWQPMIVEDPSGVFIGLVAQLVALTSLVNLVINSLERARAQARASADKAETQRDLLELMIDAIPDWVFVQDTQGRYLHVNRRMVEDSPFTAKADIIGKSVDAVYGALDPEGVEIARREFAEVMAGSPIINRVQPNNKARDQWTLATRLPLRRPDGTIIGLVAVLRDISALKQTEAELRDSEARLRAILEAVPDLMFVYDRQGTCLSVHATSPDDLVSAPTDIVGKRLDQLLLPELAAATLQRINQVLDGTPETTPYEYALDVRGGHQFYESRMVAVDTDRAMAIVRNITERKRAEAELRASQERLTQALRAARAGAWEWDMITGHVIWSEENFLVMGLNPATDTAAYDHWLSAVHPDDRATANAQVAEVVEQRGDLNIEFRAVWPDGSIHWLNDVGRIICDENGTPVSMYGIQIDITARIQAEAALRESQQHVESLLRLSKALEIAADAQSVFRAAREEIISTLGYSRVWLYLMDDDGQNASLLTGDDDALAQTPRTARRLPIRRDAYMEEVFSATHTVVVEDARTDPRTDKSVVAQADNRTLVSVPILLVDRRIGSLSTGTFGDEGVRPPTPAQVVYLTSMANNIATVLDRLRAQQERDRAQAALRESEANLKEAQRIAHLGNFAFDLRSQTVIWSDEVYRIFNLEIGTPLTLDLYQSLMPENDFARIMQAVAHTLETRQPYEIDHDLYLHDGQVKHLIAIGRPVADSTGQITHIFGTVQDITERRLGERERARLAAVVSSSTDIIGMSTSDGRATYINPAGLRMLGWDSLDRVQGLPISTFHTPQAAEHLMQQVLPHIQAEAFWRGETELLRKDGSSFPVLQTIFALRDENGAIKDLATIIVDITERKRAEQAIRQLNDDLELLVQRLAEEHALLHSVLDAIPARVAWKNSDLVFIGANRALADDLGLESWESLIGKTDYDVGVPREQADKFRDDDRWVIENDTPKLHFEERQTTRSGDHWLLTSKVPLRNLDGSPSGVLVVYEDITERKKMDMALRASETRYRTLVQNLPQIALMVVDRDLCMETVDGAEIARLGFDKTALEGKRIDQAFPPGTFEAYLPAIHAALAGETIVEEMPFGPETFLSTFAPLLVDPQRPDNMLLVSVNITRLKEAERAMRASEARYRTLAQHLSGMAFTLFDHDLRFTLAAGPELAHLGLTRPALEGNHVADVFPPEAVDGVAAHMRAALQGETTVFAGPFAGGIYQMTYNPIFDDQGGIVGGMSVSQNITERTRGQAEREALIQELEAKNAELERFTYTVSHDLKSPLITIRGFLGYLHEDAVKGNIDRLDQDIARIAAAADKMQRLLDELLELSRIGRKMNPAQAMPFADLAREALSLVEGRLSQRDIRVVVAPDMPVVYGDRTRLVEVLENLIDNAAKFMGDQPKPRIDIGLVEDNSLPTFFVRDNGIGIDKRYHEKIFGLFDKLDVHSEGTGVGLALARRIIEVHGGKIWVESEGEGQGAVFCFTLPPPAPDSNERAGM